MLGAVGDYSNPPIGFRHGFEQGKPRIKGGSPGEWSLDLSVIHPEVIS